MAESFPPLRSDNSQHRSGYHYHYSNFRTMSACCSFVGSRAGRHGESDLLAASKTNPIFDFQRQYVSLFLIV